jgi:hypothetical protein
MATRLFSHPSVPDRFVFSRFPRHIAGLSSVLLMTLWGSSQASAQTAPTVLCESTNNERKSCAADTSSGVALIRSTGTGVCLLGKSWGYDDKGIWVSENCGGEFALGQTALQVPGAAPARGAEADRDLG